MLKLLFPPHVSFWLPGHVVLQPSLGCLIIEKSGWSFAQTHVFESITPAYDCMLEIKETCKASYPDDVSLDDLSKIFTQMFNAVR